MFHRVSKLSHAIASNLGLRSSVLRKSVLWTAVSASGLTAVPSMSVAEGLVLEEMVITARKRVESLQDAPISVTAFSGDALNEKGFLDLTNVGDSSPNVNIVADGGISGGAAAANIFIRGVGQSDFLISGDPGVGVYIDGVYYARTIGAALDLVDLAQVEILRGPQGTLFGRNTIGGAINLTSQKPQIDDFSGKVSVMLGEKDFRSFSGAVNIPISDNVAARVAVLRREHEGYVEAVQYNDVWLGDEDVTTFRGRILWQPSDTFEIDFSADYTEDVSTAAPTVAFGFKEDLNNGGFVHGANILAGGNCTTVAGQATNSNCIGPVQSTGDKFKTNNTWRDIDGNIIKPFSEFENYGYALTARWAISDDIDLTSVTAYRDLDGRFIRSTSESTVLSFQNTTEAYTSEQWSQEFQLTGSSLDDTLNWVAGLYYFEEEGFESDTVANVLVLPPPPNGPGTIPNARPDDEFFVENKTTALFGQGTYDISDTLHLTLGLRITDEEKTGQSDTYLDFGRPTQQRVTFGIEPLEETNVTPHASMSYDFSDIGMVYASYSKGFKSGTFSTRTPLPQLFLDADGNPGNLPTADQETVTAFEVGIKAELMDGRLRANAALFYNDYEDIHVSVNTPDGVNIIFVNGGEARFQGLEADLTFLATDQLLLRSTIGLMDAEYTKISDDAADVLDKDSPLYATPDYKISLDAEYVFRAGKADIKTILSWTFVDEQSFTSASISPAAVPGGDKIVRADEFEDSYDFASLSVSYIPDDAPWNVSLHVKNLTDADYRTASNDHTSEDADQFGVTQSQYVRPREVQIKFDYNF